MPATDQLAIAVLMGSVAFEDDDTKAADQLGAHTDLTLKPPISNRI